MNEISMESDSVFHFVAEGNMETFIILISNHLVFLKNVICNDRARVYGV